MSSFQILVWIVAVVPFMTTFVLFRFFAVAVLRLFSVAASFRMGQGGEDALALQQLGPVKYILACGVFLLGLPLFAGVEIYQVVIALYDGFLYVQSFGSLLWQIAVCLVAGCVYGLWSWRQLRTPERVQSQASR